MIIIFYITIILHYMYGQYIFIIYWYNLYNHNIAYVTSAIVFVLLGYPWPAGSSRSTRRCRISSEWSCCHDNIIFYNKDILMLWKWKSESYQELNPGFLAWTTSPIPLNCDNRTTTSPQATQMPWVQFPASACFSLSSNVSLHNSNKNGRLEWECVTL